MNLSLINRLHPTDLWPGSDHHGVAYSTPASVVADITRHLHEIITPAFVVTPGNLVEGFMWRHSPGENKGCTEPSEFALISGADFNALPGVIDGSTRNCHIYYSGLT